MNRPGVGVGVIVVRQDTVLLGKRLTNHGTGCWQFPGGHLEYGESITECAVREVREETGAEIANIRLGPYTNDIFDEAQRHYITLFAIADYAGGEIQPREPEKCAHWRWFSWSALPTPLFLPIRNLLQQNFDFHASIGSAECAKVSFHDANCTT